VSIFRSEQYRLALTPCENAFGYKTGTTAWGVADGAYPVGLLKGYEPPDPEIEWKDFKQIGVASSRNIETLVQGPFSLSGNIPFTIQDARMIALAFGSDSVSGLADPYTHTIKPADELPSFGAVVSRLTSGVGNDYNRIYSGLKVDQLSLAAESSGELKASVTVQGQNVTQDNASDAPDVTALDDEPYWFYQSTITFWSTEIGRLQSFEMTLSNNIDGKRYFKTAPVNSVSELLEGGRQFSLKADIAIDDMTIYDKLINGTNFDISLYFERASGDTLKISSDISLDMQTLDGGANNCYISKAPHSVPDSNEVVVPVEIIMKNAYAVIENDYATSYVALA
jgi:hypothetical protein